MRMEESPRKMATPPEEDSLESRISELCGVMGLPGGSTESATHGEEGAATGGAVLGEWGF